MLSPVLLKNGNRKQDRKSCPVSARFRRKWIRDRSCWSSGSTGDYGNKSGSSMLNRICPRSFMSTFRRIRRMIVPVQPCYAGTGTAVSAKSRSWAMIRRRLCRPTSRRTTMNMDRKWRRQDSSHMRWTGSGPAITTTTESRTGEPAAAAGIGATSITCMPRCSE